MHEKAPHQEKVARFGRSAAHGKEFDEIEKLAVNVAHNGDGRRDLQHVGLGLEYSAHFPEQPQRHPLRSQYAGKRD